MAQAIYTIYVCPDCGYGDSDKPEPHESHARGGDPYSKICYGRREPVEVVPRAIVEPVVAAAAATMPRIQDDLTLALAEYRQAVGQ